METKIIKINRDFDNEDLGQAIDIIRNGGLVAFPTETVYGLGGNALDPEVANKIYQAKGRPSDNPLIVHIAKKESMDRLAVEIPKEAYKLADIFWPGPLTMILKKRKNVPYETTGGLETVALRFPGNKIARKLIEGSGIYLAAPSANTSGRPSPTKADHVIEDLLGKVDMIIDGGDSVLGLESTIIDLTVLPPVILRPGFITKIEMEKIIGPINQSSFAMENDFAKAPGMKYKHYAPKGELFIYEGKQKNVEYAINKEANKRLLQGNKVGIIATEESKNNYSYGIVKAIGSRKEEQTIAAGLFNILREFDQLGVDYIYSESFTGKGLGYAIMNRMLKASGHKIVLV